MATSGKNNHSHSPKPANQGREDSQGVDHGKVTEWIMK